MTSSPTLSSDLFFEILTHVPSKSLGKFRLVSKEWKEITYDSIFKKIYCQRMETLCGFFIQSMISNNYFSSFVSIDSLNKKSFFDFLPGRDIKIEASAIQGIFLCRNNDHRNPRYYVCKPTTRQWQQIPNPKTRFFTTKIAMTVLQLNPKLHYKVLRLSRYKTIPRSTRCEILRCEIFDSETWVWKQLNDVKFPVGVFLGFRQAISVFGTLHWFMNNKQIFSFNLVEEKWECFSLPDPLCERDDRYRFVQLAEFEGKLSTICMDEDFVEIWVMESYRGGIWNMKYRSSIGCVKKLEKYVWFLCFYSSDIIIMRRDLNIVYFNFKNNTCNIVRLQQVSDPQEEIFPIFSDFEECNFAGKSVIEHRSSRVQHCNSFFSD